MVMGFDSTAGIQHQKGGVPWKHGMTGVKVNKCKLKKPSKNSTRSQQKSASEGEFFVRPIKYVTLH